MKHTNLVMELAKQHGIPAEVIQWRMECGVYGAQLTRKPEYLFYASGKAYTLKMLSEKFGVSVKVLRTRMHNGEVMPDLVRPTCRQPREDPSDKELHRSMDAESRRERINAVEESKKELDALVSAHGDRLEYFLENKYHPDDVVFEGVTEYQAAANAARLYAKGRAMAGAGLLNKAVYHG